MWVTAYYPAWQQRRLPPPEIDLSAVTHLVHFSVLPKPDGSLDFTTHELTDTHIRETVAVARRAKRPLLLCIGGQDSRPAFLRVLPPDRRPAFIAALVDAVKSRGYDGLDIDMEPIEKADADLYSGFIRELRTALKKANPRYLLTTATLYLPEMHAALQDHFDQINLMTYEMSGAWDGWVAWHSSPLESGGKMFPTVRRPLPSITATIREWTAAGVRPARLGFGIGFFGTLWHGVANPGDDAKGAKTEGISYADIAAKWLRPERRHWDNVAKVPYIAVPADDPKDRAFISYDDVESIPYKVDFARRAGLGGLIIWELSGGHLPNAPRGRRDPLLPAVKQAVR